MKATIFFSLMFAFSTASLAKTQWVCKGAINVLKEPLELSITTDNGMKMSPSLNVTHSPSQILSFPLSVSESNFDDRKLSFNLLAVDFRFGVIETYDIKFVLGDYTQASAKAVVVSKSLFSCADKSGLDIDINTSNYDKKSIDINNCFEGISQLEVVSCSKSVIF